MDMNKDDNILVCGHSGLGGSALIRVLTRQGYTNLHGFSREDGDLTRPDMARLLLDSVRPDYLFLLAARVGGIGANSSMPVEFLQENMRIELNVMEAARNIGVKKLLFLGSACAYPKHAPVPIKEDSLLTGLMEPTNLPYALAKISGVVLCDAYRSEYGCNFISAMPTNLYGVGDTYDLNHSHVVPAMIMKMHKAKVEERPIVELWGTGTPRREFLYADDLAEACILLMEKYDLPGTINIGTGDTIGMMELACAVANAVEYGGSCRWDTAKPDGTPNRQIDSSRIFSLGWSPKTPLLTGLANAYADYLSRYAARP